MRGQPARYRELVIRIDIMDVSTSSAVSRARNARLSIAWATIPIAPVIIREADGSVAMDGASVLITDSATSALPPTSAAAPAISSARMPVTSSQGSAIVRAINPATSSATAGTLVQGKRSGRPAKRGASRSAIPATNKPIQPVT